MNPAALTPALFTPPAAPAQGQAGATGAQAGQQGSGSFSQLLDSTGPASSEDTVLPSSTALHGDVVATDQADETADAAGDAPWPPLGLETLLTTAATPVTPATATVATAITLPAAAMAAQEQASTLLQPASSPPGLADSDALLPAANLASANSTQPALPALAHPTAGSNKAAPADVLALASQTTAGGEADGAGGQMAATAMLNGIPTNPTPDNGAVVALAGLGATGMAAPLAANDGQASLLPTRADMGGEHFDADVAQGIEYMVEHKLQSARIRISPQQLGMIEVELRLDGDRVHANFSSAHADVRQALQDSLPRLRDLLDASGLQMGQAAVGDGAVGQERAQPPAQDALGSNTGSGDGEPTPATPSQPVWRHNRLLDTYA